VSVEANLQERFQSPLEKIVNPVILGVMVATKRTYSLVSNFHPTLVIRFLVVVTPDGNPIHVNIYLESHGTKPYMSELRLPHFHVAIGKPMLGVVPEHARHLWRMLVGEFGWRQMIHTP